MKLNKRTLAIATSLSLCSLGIGIGAASARDDQIIYQSGPIIPLEQIVRIVQSAYPNAQIEKIKLEREEERGLVYEIDLTNDRDIYINANTGQVFGTDED
ncbi:MAG TPA: PepSY domain-containing protein [Crinalium sp.]|jgi:uncharacterized membrane protein YkoI